MSNTDKVRNNIKKQIREEYGKLVYTYTCHNKDAQIVNKRTKILKIVKLVLSGLSTAGFVSAIFSNAKIATVYKGNIIKNLIMDCQSYTKYRPNETTGGIFVSWRRKEELPTGA